MPLFDKPELEAAARLVYKQMPPTPQYSWPLINEAVGAEVWVKHENHTPTGAFKIRGGITFMDWLLRTAPEARGICTATRGNHGQSQARAATAAGLEARIFVPHGNSSEKNAAMRAFGAKLTGGGGGGSMIALCEDEMMSEEVAAAIRQAGFRALLTQVGG